MIGFLLAAVLTEEQAGCMGEGSEIAPMATYSPPAGVISVTTQDGQIYRFQYPPGTEHYRLGCYCNGWGIGYGSSTYRYTHYDNSLYGVSLVSSTTLEWGPTYYRWRVTYRTNDNYFIVTHNFSYCPTVGALRVVSVITNNSGVTQYGVKFKRYIDWDVNPGYFSNNYFYRTSDMCYAASSGYIRYVGLAALSPTPSVIELYGWDHYSTYTSSPDYGYYNGDGYCLLDWSLGTMAAGETRVIDACYVAGSSYSDLLAQKSACNTCIVGSGDELGVGEAKAVRDPIIRTVSGGITIDHYEGEVKVFHSDGRLVYENAHYTGGTVPLKKGLYVVKLQGYSSAVIVK
ncbi:MAG: hypothetical protein GXO39_07915 [Thermotogae bacterium]|nr:hypothetical protein [Thermotogota bacterium]